MSSGKVRVFTLALEHHHWFFVHGVRVHNKGGGGRGGRGGGRVGGTSRSYTSASHSTPRVYVVHSVWLHSGDRRRYGAYMKEESECDFASLDIIEGKCYAHIALGATDFNNTTQLPAYFDCENHSTARCCHACMQCKEETCMDRINGCESFLGDIHTECPAAEGGMDVGVLVGLIIG